MFTIPALALVIGFIGVPIGQAIYYSFTQWDGITSTWIGPSTWTQAFHNSNLWTALENNAKLLLAVPFALAIPLAIAVLLQSTRRRLEDLPLDLFLAHRHLVGRARFSCRTILRLPRHAQLHHPLLRVLPHHTNMLGYTSTAIWALGITFVFTMIGTNTMLFLTGLATLDLSLEEAARIDGASRWRIFRSITLPHLRRFIQLAFVMTVIALFSALFSLIFVMTGGGPGYSTTTMEFLVYQTGFSEGDFGTAALYGIILFVITAIVGIVQLRLIGSDE